MVDSFRHAFIVTYGRTGSTVLMSLLNASGRARIFGENYGYLYGLHRSLVTLGNWQSHGREGPTPRHPFFGADTFDFPAARAALLAEARGFFDRFPPNESCDIRGFKDTGYLVPDLAQYLDFLNRTFDHSLFIFLTRDAASVAKSGFYRAYPEDVVLSAIRKADADFLAYATRYPERTSAIEYLDVVQRGPALVHLLARLGLDIPESTIDAVLARPASYAHRSVGEIVPGVMLQIDREKLERDGIEFRLFHLPKLASLLREFKAEGLLLALDGDPVIGVFASGTQGRVEAETGLPSPGLAVRFPDMPLSTSARFRFVDDILATGSGRYVISGEFRRRGVVPLATISAVKA